MGHYLEPGHFIIDIEYLMIDKIKKTSLEVNSIYLSRIFWVHMYTRNTGRLSVSFRLKNIYSLVSKVLDEKMIIYFGIRWRLSILQCHLQVANLYRSDSSGAGQPIEDGRRITPVAPYGWKTTRFHQAIEDWFHYAGRTFDVDKSLLKQTRALWDLMSRVSPQIFIDYIVYYRE
jgi:hypothetical protein